MSSGHAAQPIDKDGPTMHALLIGVSAYPHLYEHEDDPAPAEHLGLRKLASSALTVHRIYEWPEGRKSFLPLPLASCRVLVSPSDSELEAEPELAKWLDAPSLDNTINAIAQWRDNLSHDSRSIGLVYFAGHGAKRERRDDVLLLNDFAKPKSLRVLKYAIDSTSLVDGMASKQFPNIARTQLYFFDACRVKPLLFKKYEEANPDPIWDKTELSKMDDRSMLTL